MGRRVLLQNLLLASVGYVPPLLVTMVLSAKKIQITHSVSSQSHGSGKGVRSASMWSQQANYGGGTTGSSIPNGSENVVPGSRCSQSAPGSADGSESGKWIGCKQIHGKGVVSFPVLFLFEHNFEINTMTFKEVQSDPALRKKCDVPEGGVVHVFKHRYGGYLLRSLEGVECMEFYEERIVPVSEKGVKSKLDEILEDTERRIKAS